MSVSPNTAARRLLAEPVADSKSNQSLSDNDVRIIATSNRSLDPSLPAAMHISPNSQVTLVTTKRNARPQHNVYTWEDPTTGKTGTFTLPAQPCIVQ